MQCQTVREGILGFLIILLLIFAVHNHTSWYSATCLLSAFLHATCDVSHWPWVQKLHLPQTAPELSMGSAWCGFPSLPEQVNSCAWSHWDTDIGICVVDRYRHRQSAVNLSWLLSSLQAPIISVDCPAGVPNLAQSLCLNVFVGGPRGGVYTPPGSTCA